MNMCCGSNTEATYFRIQKWCTGIDLWKPRTCENIFNQYHDDDDDDDDDNLHTTGVWQIKLSTETDQCHVYSLCTIQYLLNHQMQTGQCCKLCHTSDRFKIRQKTFAAKWNTSNTYQTCCRPSCNFLWLRHAFYILMPLTSTWVMWGAGGITYWCNQGFPGTE
jgi:hypothetical protein